MDSQVSLPLVAIKPLTSPRAIWENKYGCQERSIIQKMDKVEKKIFSIGSTMMDLLFKVPKKTLESQTGLRRYDS